MRLHAHALNFASGAALCFALSACSTSGTPDYVATAPATDLAPQARLSGHDALDARIAHYAMAHHIPESLVHAAVKRESGYNPEAKHGPYLGLMQIRYATARSMGYSGPAHGLLDAETNLKYGAPYLANAFIVAGGDQQRALRLYASGYYYEAKHRGLLGKLRTAEFETAQSDDKTPVVTAEQSPQETK
jgi:soluble lytic murein transglycosylase-like protein